MDKCLNDYCFDDFIELQVEHLVCKSGLGLIWS